MTDTTITTGHPIANLHSGLLARAGAVNRRRKFRRLLDLDDHMLDDIGVIRAEVEWAARLPIGTDAGAALRQVSQTRRRNMQ